jgi:cellulose synthase/poly-beta-1,6-N-acetylglucosamine synthase-like glycosyltransferase
MEILIVDDYSTDDTVKISNDIIGSDTRFRVLDLKSVRKEKPGDWFGKSNAVQQGSRQAKGEWLVFLDADVVLSPEIVEKAVAFVSENKLDLLSGIPYFSCDSFWTKVVQPIPLQLVLLNLFHVNKPESRVAFAFGCFILIRRSVFDKIGGYEQVKEYIADDAELAKLVKRSGFQIRIVQAQDMLTVKMYDRLAEMVEGWSKNICLGLAQNTRIHSKTLKTLFILMQFIGVFILFLLPFLLMGFSLILGLLYNVSYWGPLFLFSSLVWLSGVCVQFMFQLRHGVGNAKYALLSFLGGAVVLAVFLDAPIRILFGKGIQWRGRTYFQKESRF